MNLRISVLLLALTLTGCSSSCDGGRGEPPVVSEPTTPTELAKTEPARPAALLMRDHYAKAYEAREALIRADLASAKTAMTFLAEHQRGDALPPELRPMLDDMQRAAAAFATATTLRDAGAALSGTFARCGVCHKAAGKGPTIATTPLPDSTDAVSHMRRHHWAAQAMWEGLVTASDERFAAGAAALKDEPLDPSVFGVTAVSAADLTRLDEHIHTLGTQAAAATDLRTRADTYARLLATCATCHKLTQRGPQPLGPVEPVPDTK